MTEITKLMQQAMTENGLINHSIDGVVYTIKLLPAVQAYKVAENLIQFLAPVIGCFYDGNEDEFAESDMGTNLGLIISKQIKELDLSTLSVVLLQNVTRDGIKLNIETDLIGSKGLVVLAELTELALKENIFDFLSEWLGKKGLSIPSLGDLQKMSAQTSEESNS